MANTTTSTTSMERALLSASMARLDRWRTLSRVARERARPGAPKGAAGEDPAALLAELIPLEELCGYPGPCLMAQVHERLQNGDATGFARRVARISNALLTNSYRDNLEPWKAEEEGDVHVPDILPPAIGRGQARRPYFEVLLVSPSDRAAWPEIRETFRRLRRPDDEFVYEPV